MFRNVRFIRRFCESSPLPCRAGWPAVRPAPVALPRKSRAPPRPGRTDSGTQLRSCRKLMMPADARITYEWMLYGYYGGFYTDRYGYCTVIWWIFPLLFLCTFPIYPM